MNPPALDATIYAHLPFLLVAVSLVYSATRHDRWDLILREAGGWVVRFGGFLGGLGVALFVLSSYPRLGPYAAVGFVAFMFVYFLLSSPWFRRKKPAPAPVPAAPAPAPPVGAPK